MSKAAVMYDATAIRKQRAFGCAVATEVAARTVSERKLVTVAHGYWESSHRGLGCGRSDS